MSSRVYSVFNATMASAATSTPAVELTTGYRTAYLEVPTMTTSSTHYIQAANASGANYRRVKQWNPASAAVSLDFQVHSTATQAMVPIPAGLKYVKVESQDTQVNGVFYKIHTCD